MTGGRSSSHGLVGGTGILTVVGHVISFSDGRPAEVLGSEEAYLHHKTTCVPKVLGGTKQQETLLLRVGRGGVKGLKLIKRVFKGVLGPFEETLEVGDFKEGVHECPLPASDVPNTLLSRGRYRCEVSICDASGALLWKLASAFQIVKPPGDGSKHVPCACFA
eukprot:TRINITY_DN750_c0_g1_i4.p2 TRINITY_DN750_c0_g1~~TRINITY_DN750_c0_g1_i4.p2  ORF type:complete len:163 (+),score=36.56 TRINITY_DN750_c0_g1_i4:66-554(+)